MNPLIEDKLMEEIRLYKLQERVYIDKKQLESMN